MDSLYITLIAGCALITSALCIIFYAQLRTERKHGRAREAEAEERARQREMLIAEQNGIRERDLTKQLGAANEEVGRLRTDNVELRELVAKQSAEIKNLCEKGEHDKEELEKLQASFRAEFRNMASEMLEERGKQFKETNKESMEILLKPFRDNITEFRERVEKIFTNSSEQQGALKAELNNLMKLNQRITEETNNLTAALKGNSKVQGDWGEAILETILEGSNLIKGVHYHTQTSIKDDDGREMRPDVIINMPDNKQIVVDSKVSLRDYVKYTEAGTEDERKRHKDTHKKAIRNHIDELCGKEYQNLLKYSPDFVIMFVPSEPAFLTALQDDNTIWDYAYKKKVIISSPTNLFAMLKLIDDLWKRDNQSRNAIAIADEGAKLYDKFVGFVDTLSKVGKGLESVSENYENAMKQLVDGRGNLVSRAEKMRKLGLKASKEMSAQILDAADIEPDIPDTAELNE